MSICNKTVNYYKLTVNNKAIIINVYNLLNKLGQSIFSVSCAANSLNCDEIELLGKILNSQNKLNVYLFMLINCAQFFNCNSTWITIHFNWNINWLHTLFSVTWLTIARQGYLQHTVILLLQFHCYCSVLQLSLFEMNSYCRAKWWAGK